MGEGVRFWTGCRKSVKSKRKKKTDRGYVGGGIRGKSVRVKEKIREGEYGGEGGAGSDKDRGKNGWGKEYGRMEERVISVV